IVSIDMMDTSFESPEPALSAEQRFINSKTGLPNFRRFTEHNIEDRTIAARALYREGFYPSIFAATHTWKCWRRIAQGHHIQQRALRQYANSVLKATYRQPHVSRFWALRFLRRYHEVFHRRKSCTLAANRKAMSDRANVEEWFTKWTRFVQENDINFSNVWNFDETGFMIGYLMNGIMIWTFIEIDNPILTDAHTTISVTVTESISAKGEIIAPFIIMPGVQIPSRWVDNDLEDEATIVTTPKGYIDDVWAQDFFDHFERLSRPQNRSGTRVVLLGGCESHFTKELYHKAKEAEVILYSFPPCYDQVIPTPLSHFSTFTLPTVTLTLHQSHQDRNVNLRSLRINQSRVDRRTSYRSRTNNFTSRSKNSTRTIPIVLYL
ncbi:hypothetical protein FPSE_01391, partial [Fusarium pseudograminearum CS3096]